MQKKGYIQTRHPASQKVQFKKNGLIYYCLTSSEHYFSYKQYDIKLNDIYKLYRADRREGSTGSTTFVCHRRSMESSVGTIHLVFCTMRLLIFEIYKKCIQRAGKMVFSKDVTHYCQRQRQGFPCNNLKIPIESAPLIRQSEQFKIAIQKSQKHKQHHNTHTHIYIYIQFKHILLINSV